MVLALVVFVLAVGFRGFVRYGQTYYDTTQHRVVTVARQDIPAPKIDFSQQKMRQAALHLNYVDASAPYTLAIISGGIGVIFSAFILAIAAHIYLQGLKLRAPPKITVQLFNYPLTFYRRPPPVEL